MIKVVNCKNVVELFVPPIEVPVIRNIFLDLYLKINMKATRLHRQLTEIS